MTHPDPVSSVSSAPSEPSEPRRPNRRLAGWISLLVGAATVVSIVVAATTPLSPAIALPWPGLALADALLAGTAFWLTFGLLGGLRARLRPGGAVVTFSMPFIVAGTLLGGPFAGALMGWVSELEVREIRTQPWYGILANHAVSALAAVAAAFCGGPARDVLSGLLPGQDGLAFFGGAIVTAFVFDAVNVALVVPTLAIRHGLTLGEASRSQDAAFRATAIGEGILAWNMAAGYQLLGWWAPVATVVLVMIVWQAYDRSEALRRDEKTGLLNDAGLRPRLEAATAAATAGRRPSALLALDLDEFWAVNDTYGYEAGDEVLLVTARRILVAIRATDSVARKNRAGDEFAILLDGVPDVETARQLAERIGERIAEPIRLRTVPGVARVGVSIGVVHLERGSRLSASEAMLIAEARLHTAKALQSGVATEETHDAAALERRLAVKARQRRGDEEDASGPRALPPSASDEADGQNLSVKAHRRPPSHHLGRREGEHA